MSDQTAAQGDGGARKGLNGYMAFYRDKAIEVWAATTVAAQTLAAERMRAKKSHQVRVVLCERADGSGVTHSTSSLG